MQSLKIAYKGKNILLTKGTNSIKKIEQEINSRFPGEFPYGVVLKHQGNLIQSFEQIQSLALASVNKSLKLEAEPAEQKKLEVIQQEQKKSQVQSAPEQKAVEVENKIEINQAQTKIQNKEPVNQEKQQPNHVIQEHLAIDSMSSDQEQIHKKDIQIKTNQKQNQAPVKEEVHEAPVVEEVKNQQKKEQNLQPQIPIEKKQQIQPQIVKCDNIQQAPKQQIQEQKTQNIQKQPIVQEQQKIAERKESSQLDQGEGISMIQVQKELNQIEPGVYQCIFCRQLQYCNVCETKRRLYPDSKFFKLVDAIVDKKLTEKFVEIQAKLLEKLSGKQSRKQPILKVNQIVEKVQKQSKDQFAKQKQRQIIRYADIKIIELPTNKKEVNVGDQIYMEFMIKVNQKVQFNHNISVIDQKNGEIKLIKFANDAVIRVGPFTAQNQGKFDRTFRLCFVQQDGSIQLFGHKFGFSVVAEKPQIKKQLSNGFRQAIQQIRKGYKIQRSTEYLIEKLKEINITEDNYQENKDILPDIIQTV